MKLTLSVVTETPNAWRETMAEGAQAALRQALAKNPNSIAILYELPKSGVFEFVQFPPGVAATYGLIAAIFEECVLGRGE